ncbi:MAG: hypothetical protein ACMUIE_10670 [Thermoplasmatota archaeon]
MRVDRAAQSMVLIALVFIIGAIGINTVAEPPSRGVSANCGSCHSSSIYQTVDIRTIENPDTIPKNGEGWINVTVDVSASHKNSVYSGFSIDVWLHSTGKIDTGTHQVLTGQAPSGPSSPYTWSRTFNFKVKGITGGQDTITVNAKMDPVHESPPVTDTQQISVQVSNQPPALGSGSVDPEVGDVGTPFSFRVDFSDPDGDIPTSIKVFVDGSSYDLSDLPGGDGSTKDGELYGIDNVMLAVGEHNHHFEASDGSAVVRFPESGELPGPDVIKPNSPPVLENPGVYPEVGYPGADYEFSVIYGDTDDDAPDPGVRLMVDGSGTWVRMSTRPDSAPYLRDGIMTNGELFAASISLELGEHTYGFNTSDGGAWIEIGPFSGPDVVDRPVLRARISSPGEGSSLLTNETVEFVGEGFSNVDSGELRYRWTSNISGELGTEGRFNRTLAPGSHYITLNVTSELLGLSDEESINITVSVPVFIPPPPVIISSSPEPESSIKETDNITFHITLNPENPFVAGGDPLKISWFLEDRLQATGQLEWTYGTGYLDSGKYVVYVTVELYSGIRLDIRRWNLTVIDAKAPILVLGELPGDLGSFRKRDTIEISLPVQDPAGRMLDVEWYIDGTIYMMDVTAISIELRQGGWAHEGVHIIEVVASNPDNVFLNITMEYTVISDDVFFDGGDDDSDGSEPDKERSGVLGILIIVVGTLLVLLMAAATVHDLVSPLEKPPSKQRFKMEVEEDDDHEESWEGPWEADI